MSSNDDRITCPKCNEVQISMSHLKKMHSKSCEKKDIELSKDLLCGFCWKLFPDKKYKKQHTSLCPIKRRLYQCPNCRMLLISENMYKDHVPECKERTKGGFKCKKCSDTFSSWYRWRKHTDMCIKNKVFKPFGCKDCKERFISYPQVVEHRKNDCAVLQEKFKCHGYECGQAFRTNYLLEKHKLSCTSFQPEIEYKCNYCNKKIKSAHILEKYHNSKCIVKVKQDCKERIANFKWELQEKLEEMTRIAVIKEKRYNQLLSKIKEEDQEEKCEKQNIEIEKLKEKIKKLEIDKTENQKTAIEKLKEKIKKLEIEKTEKQKKIKPTQWSCEVCSKRFDAAWKVRWHYETCYKLDKTKENLFECQKIIESYQLAQDTLMDDEICKIKLVEIDTKKYLETLKTTKKMFSDFRLFNSFLHLCLKN
jgi:hypothetical protein